MRTAVVERGPWTVVTAPDFLRGREESLVLPVDAQRGVVFGGFRREKRALDFSADGAIVEYSTGKWTQVPPAPGAPLASVRGAVVGGHLLVAGLECERAHVTVDPDLPDRPEFGPCASGSVGLRRYDLRTRQWDVVASTSDDVFRDPTSVSTVAEVGTTIVVVATHVVADREFGNALAYSTASKTWIGAPPAHRIERSCWVAGALISFKHSRVVKAVPSAPGTHEERARLEIWRPGNSGWTAKEPTDPIDTWTELRLRCTADAAVIDSGPPVGQIGTLLAYDLAGDAWTELPPKPPSVPAFGSAAGGNRLAVWNAPHSPAGADKSAYVLDLRSNTPKWVKVGRIPADASTTWFAESPSPHTRVFAASSPTEFITGDLRTLKQPAS